MSDSAEEWQGRLQNLDDQGALQIELIKGKSTVNVVRNMTKKELEFTCDNKLFSNEVGNTFLEEHQEIKKQMAEELDKLLVQTVQQQYRNLLMFPEMNSWQFTGDVTIKTVKKDGEHKLALEFTPAPIISPEELAKFKKYELKCRSALIKNQLKSQRTRRTTKAQQAQKEQKDQQEQ